MTNWWKTTTTVGLVSMTIGMPYGASAAGDWVENFKIKGDFRYRYEYIDEETKKEERHRNRLRLRLGIQSKVNETVDVGAVLASGGDDPISTNQTLDSQASTKDIRLDQAYFAWKPVSGLAIMGGKMKNPFYVPVKSELLWDVDLRPEGLALQYDKDLFINAGFFYMEERSQDDDSYLFGGQVGYQGKFNGTEVTAGVGHFSYTDVKGRPLADFDFLDGEGSFGNTLDAGGNFITEYKEWELFGDVTFKAGTMPVALFVDYVVNADADDDDTGYVVGFKVNKAKAPGSWDFRYLYHRAEADALFGAWADSDFIGGGTDGKGHELNFGYQIAKGWKFAFSYFDNEKGLNGGHDYNRIMADLKFSF